MEVGDINIIIIIISMSMAFRYLYRASPYPSSCPEMLAGSHSFTYEEYSPTQVEMITIRIVCLLMMSTLPNRFINL